MTESNQTPPPPPPSSNDPGGNTGNAAPGLQGAPAIYAGPPPTKDAVTMGMLCHLLGIFTGFLGPLIIWLLKKDEHPFIDDQGKEALNFQIVAMLATFACLLGFCLAPFL